MTDAESVETNPCTSPAIITDARQSRGARLAFRVIAIGCWLLCGLIGLAGISASQAPAAGVAFRMHPYRFSAVLVCMFVLPTVAFFLWGLGIWRGSARLAIWGIALFVPFFVMMVVRAFFW